MKRSIGPSVLMAVGCFLGLAGSTSAQTLFSDNFDAYTSPLTVTAPGVMSGPSTNYNVLFNGGTADFTAIFGYDYSTVTTPTTIPSAPNSGGTTKGLFLTVNKDATAAVTAVNLFPLNQTFSGNYVVKFDVWMNYNTASGSTETLLAGINQSGTIANRPGQTASDGQFFALNGDGGSSPTSATLRDFSCFIGTGAAPTLLLTNAGNTAHFGPTPPLGNNFDNADSAIAAFFSQKVFSTVTNAAGAPGFRWNSVEIRYIGDNVTWLINNKIFAQYTNTTAYTSGDIMIGYLDFFSGTGNSANFAIVDNIRVESANTLVSVAATTPNADEAGPTAGAFTIARTGDSSADVTVNYVISGTASSGADYAALPGSVVIPAGQTSVNVPVTPVDDAIAELTETVIMTLTNGTGYVVSAPLAATVNIIDNETPLVSLTVTQPTMYERLSGDYITFRLGRLGDTNVNLNVNLTYTGTAVAGTDYTSTPSVNMAPGVLSQTFTVTPLDNNTVDGNRTIICTVASGAGYVIGTTNSATGTLIDDELATETVLFSDSLATNSTANWNVTFGSNNGMDDKEVLFEFLANNDSVPLPPNGSNTVLKLTVNKDEVTALGAAGVNLYPAGQSFSGDYAVRFNMYLAQGFATNTATEFALFGINHSGTATNWYYGGTNHASNPTGLPFGCDGLFCAISADGSASAPGDFALMTGTNNPAIGPVSLKTATAASQVNVFKKPPFSGNFPGAPSYLATSPGATWVDVELKTVGGIITLSVDKTVILTYTNTTAYTSGDLMLGYMDSYDSIGQQGAAYFSNLRVVDLTAATPHITGVTDNQIQVTILFTGGSNDAAAAFHLQSSAVVDGSSNYTDDNGAVITGSAGNYQAAVNVNGSRRFYRIRR